MFGVISILGSAGNLTRLGLILIFLMIFWFNQIMAAPLFSKNNCTGQTTNGTEIMEKRAVLETIAFWFWVAYGLAIGLG